MGEAVRNWTATHCPCCSSRGTTWRGWGAAGGRLVEGAGGSLQCPSSGGSGPGTGNPGSVPGSHLGKPNTCAKSCEAPEVTECGCLGKMGPGVAESWWLSCAPHSHRHSCHRPRFCDHGPYRLLSCQDPALLRTICTPRSPPITAPWQAWCPHPQPVHPRPPGPVTTPYGTRRG